MDSYNKACLEEIDSFFRELNSRRNNLPSETAIFNLLSTYSYARQDIGESVERIAADLINLAITINHQNTTFTRKRASSEGSIELELIDRNGSTTSTPNYKYVHYHNYIASTQTYREFCYDDMIWLHFSILHNSIKSVGEELIKILANNSIEHHLRIPNLIGPDALCVGVYDKKSAERLLDLCVNDPIICDSITLNNPFLPHKNGIGIIKEMKDRSYTRHLSSLIYEYARTSKDKELNFDGFYKFVLTRFKETKINHSFFERNMDYQVALAIYCIHENDDYLKELMHMMPITFDREEFERYRINYEDGEYVYSSREEDITKDNYLRWLRLQAHNCIQRILYEQNGKLSEDKNIVIGGPLLGRISNMIDGIMRGGSYSTISNYNDAMVNGLFPYLVGYYAYQYKFATLEEINMIINKVKNRMVTKLAIKDTNKNFYQIGDKTIQSTIPPIVIDEMIIGIEYLDYEINYCNVFIYKDDNVTGHLGLFLDLDKDKVWEAADITASTYRASVARCLTKFNSLETERIKRGVHEGLFVHLNFDDDAMAIKQDSTAKALS